ncbi:efflux transporter outer membrane subunit [Acinetobacter nectaris]|uniref:efflux transporter outer membrane subunit n=1 Tax=Acinetobacter nectaris TaxID=1219382 RepID=UPI001EFFEF76|nr:efflux transporter outer membrane subunit [Acinetobacter nectaris]MCF9034973.1 efflux transporter outer membrane subunit [Acinetobacter nectaris]
MNTYITKTIIPISVCALVLSGCSALIKTPYQAPQVNIPATFQKSQPNNKQISIDTYADCWWTLFGDKHLDQLVQQVLTRNNNLAVAGLTLKQARLKVGLAENQQGLRVNASTSVGHTIDLNNGSEQSQGTSISTGVSYQIDLFGQLARQTESSKWEALATEQDLQATAQALVATTAKLYWQLAYLHESKTTAEESLNNSQKLYKLVHIQYTAGAVSDVDLTQAAQAVQSQQANLSRIAQSLVETRTAIAVLLHIPVQQLDITEPSRLPQIRLPQISSGLPADILSRRPDLKAAELRLREALANKDAVKASFYPAMSLTSGLGTSSTSLTQLIKNPVLTLGANLSLPFIQYNDMKKSTAVSQLDYEKAILQYRQTLYQAFADVENALSNRTELDYQVTAQAKNLALSQKAERLVLVQYKYGAVALKNLLDQQENSRAAQLSLVNTKQSQYNAYVTLMQALGGSPITQLP